MKAGALKVRWSWALVSIFLGTSAALADETLFIYEGKSFTASDLDPSDQQALHDIRSDYYRRLEALVDKVLIERHVEAQAKKTGKSKAEIEASLFKGSEPTKKEVTAWFEANKGRLPPNFTLEQVSSEIEAHLKSESEKKKQGELVRRLKGEGKLKLAIPEPKAPQVAIDIAGYPVKGNANAKVMLVEFADYQCPHCKAAGEALRNVMRKYKDKVKLVYLDFPINRSGISRLVAHGAVCADKQGKYWPYHDLAFSKQRELSKDSPAALAKEVGLDIKAFEMCMASDEPAQRVDRSRAEGDRIGITGTPAIFINGRRVRGYDEEELVRVIEHALSGAES